MIPIRLVIDNFSCYERSEIDFTQFSIALIVGRNTSNAELSNGVGKTTIFKAIEYVLFNESDEALEDLIRDDCNSCKVILYFNIGDQLYRLSRSRTRKGVSDLSLHKRTTVDAVDSLIYTDSIDKDSNIWKDLSSRRTADTEKDVEKLIKINFKIFRSTVHFLQHDFTGIATLTPEKRKYLLKEVLNILIYSKLEKIAKDKSTDLNKDLTKSRALLETLGDPNKEISDSEKSIFNHTALIVDKTVEHDKVKEDIESINYQITEISSLLNSFDDKNNQIKQKETSIKNELIKLKTSINDYANKNKNVSISAKNILSDIKIETEKKNKLSEINFEELSELESQFSSLKENTLTDQINIKKLNEELEELKIPMPDDSVCKHCRQPLTKEHREICQKEIDKRIKDISEILIALSNNIKDRNFTQSQTAIKISQLNNSKKELESSISKIDNLKNDYNNKKQLFVDYEKIVNEQKESLSLKEKELDDLNSELEKCNTDEVKKLRTSLDEQRKLKEVANVKSLEINKEITHIKSLIAVLEHKTKQAKDNLNKKTEISSKILELEDELEVYPSVINGFSSSGIPNLIIQSVLDDWQTESNILLSQIRPGLQLSFLVEKEKSDGETADTLDIKYFINGRTRTYGLLSGAQKVSIAFALKLGLAFLLQKMFGIDVKFLLLDEVDGPFDPLGVNAFVDIVKFFQKDFTILVITHNDRLKDKFNHAILVEQDQNMISKAKVVSSW